MCVGQLRVAWPQVAVARHGLSLRVVFQSPVDLEPFTALFVSSGNTFKSLLFCSSRFCPPTRNSYALLVLTKISSF